MPKGIGYKKRKPKKGTGGAIAKKGGSLKKSLKDIGKLRKKNVESMGKSYIENYKNRKR